MTIREDADFLIPLIRAIRVTIQETVEKHDNQYNEMDVYRALTFSLISFATRNLREEERDGVQTQYASIAQKMVESGLQQAEQDGAYLTSIICGAAQSVNTFVDMIESASSQAE